MYTKTNTIETDQKLYKLTRRNNCDKAQCSKYNFLQIFRQPIGFQELLD